MKMSIDICENQQLINNFQERLGSSPDKDLLISILNDRLNGHFNIGYNSNDDNLSFDFKYNLNEDQIAGLDTFSEVYHTFPLVNIEYMSIIGPIVSLIEKNYNATMTFMSSIHSDFRQCLFHFKNYSEILFELNKILQWSLIIPKLDRLENELKKTYEFLLPENFVLKDLIYDDSSKSSKFSDIYYIINNFIQDKLRKNIQIPGNIEKLCNTDKIINRLFWIVYADDFKFIDNVERMYTISDDTFDEYQEKMMNDPNFNYENCVIMENGNHQIIRVNIIENFADQLMRSEENIEKIFDITLKNYKNDDKHIIKKKLEEALDDYLKINVKNNEEIELYKLLFSLNVEFRMLGIGIDSLENMIKTK